MKLEHIAPYLLYGLKIVIITNPCKDEIGTLHSLSATEGVSIYAPTDEARFNHHNYLERSFRDIKPILRPLSDLTKEITHNGETFVPIEELNYRCGDCETLTDTMSVTTNTKYGIVKRLFEWHFDVFGLIESGEAIDINTLEAKKNL